MEFTRPPVVVWKPSRDDATATRAAATCRQVGVVKRRPFSARASMLGASSPTTIASVVVPTDIISDEEMRLLFGCKQDSRQKGNNSWDKSVHALLLEDQGQD